MGSRCYQSFYVTAPMTLKSAEHNLKEMFTSHENQHLSKRSMGYETNYIPAGSVGWR